ncbi:MAG: MotA/TolQ/ExbB proton channel family protein, partial [Fibrobacterota bacterium]
PGFVFMWILLIVGVTGVALVLERLIFLLRHSNSRPAKFMDQVLKYIEEDRIDQASALCEKKSSMALSRIIKAGLASASKGSKQIKNGIEEAMLNLVPTLEKRTNYLAMIGNVATLIGLMGTIYGLILSFAAVGKPGIDPAEKSALLAQGISAAMFTTLTGLMIAIPAIVIFTFLQNKTQQIVDEVDEYGTKLTNVLTERSYKTYKYHISAAQLKEGLGLHVRNNNIKIFTDNKLIKEISI